MKNYYVKCIMKFNDIEENTLREVNDEFWCTKERYEYLKDRVDSIMLIYLLRFIFIYPLFLSDLF